MNRVRARHILGVLVLAGALGLGACATPTPYQPALDGHGYAEQAIEDDRYRVTFSGNSQTPRETVENYLLYRAAEVTLQRGYDHFVIVDRETERTTTYVSTTTGFGGHHGFHPFYRGYSSGFSRFATTTSRLRDRYAAFANIVMRGGEKPSDDPDAYDAREVLERLAPTISRREAS